jgi:hypothetical protein
MPVPESPDALTAAWLDAALRDAPAFAGCAVRGVEATVIGVGFGLDGTVARLALETDGDEAPAALVAKWAKAAQGERELRFYSELAPHLDADLATFHAGLVDAGADRALLVFEDVADAQQGDMLVGSTAPQAEALARTEARIHARMWEDDRLAGWRAWDPGADRFTGLVVERRARFLELFGDTLPAAARAVTDELETAVPAAIEQLLAAPCTLVHTDLHLDNVLFRPDDKPVVLDWPGARRGPAALDVLMLLTDCLTEEQRRARQERLLDLYVAELRANGVLDYGHEQLDRDVRHAAVHHFAGMVWWAGRDDPRAEEPRVGDLIETGVVRAAAFLADGVVGN